jgi:prepilin-type N-terminal cleavage/methylation domain-containing protein
MGRGIGESEEGARKVTKMRKGLTLMELLTVISILATLAALLYPVYLKVRSRVYETSCANQLRQIGIAIHMYANDYGDGSPYAMFNMPGALYPQYIRNRDMLICPRVVALTPSQVLERFYRAKNSGYERSTYWFVSPIGLDFPLGDDLIRFSDVFAKRGDNTPIGYCGAHQFCPVEIGEFFADEYGEGGFRFCQDLFFAPGGPVIVLRWGGQVDFVYKNSGNISWVDTDEFLIDY